MGWIADRLSRWRDGRRQRREISKQAALNDDRRRELLADLSLTPLDRLLRWWDEPPSAGVSDIQLGELERRYELRVPEDFRA